jgi:hypothetical protein
MLPWIRKIRIEGKLHDLPHPLDDELEWLVRTNHNLVLRRVDEVEAQASPEQRDPEYASELKKAASRMALVGLIVRLDHWVAALASDVAAENTRDKGLVWNLKRLNQRTGPGPVSLGFFSELVTVRDSIIHADSQVEWTYKDKKKRVADRYASSLGEIEFTQEHLDEAIDSAVKQVKWYHNELLDEEAKKGRR